MVTVVNTHLHASATQNKGVLHTLFAYMLLRHKVYLRIFQNNNVQTHMT